MFRILTLLLTVSTTAVAHDLLVEFALSEPDVTVSAAYGPGQPAAGALVEILSPGGASEPTTGTTNAEGHFTFAPDIEGDWRVIVDDGYGHLQRASIRVDWMAPAPPEQPLSSVWTRAGAGLIVIGGFTFFLRAGRRRTAAD